MKSSNNFSFVSAWKAAALCFGNIFQPHVWALYHLKSQWSNLCLLFSKLPLICILRLPNRILVCRLMWPVLMWIVAWKVQKRILLPFTGPLRSGDLMRLWIGSQYQFTTFQNLLIKLEFILLFLFSHLNLLGSCNRLDVTAIKLI